MDQAGDTQQQKKGNSEGAEKMDKLQQELDDLEKRAQEELSRQKPSFAVVEEEKEGVSERDMPEPQAESAPGVSPPIVDTSETKSDGDMGKVLSEEVVGEQPQVATIDSSQSISQQEEPMQVQANESQEKQKEPVDTNKMTKSIFWIALVLFLITLTAVGAYYVGSRNAPATVQPTQTPLAVKTPMPTPTLAPTVMSFVNEIYVYSFDYPGSMSIVKDLSTPDEIVTVTEDENSLVIYAGTESFSPASDADLESESEYVISGITTTKEVYPGMYDVYVFPENESDVRNIVVRYKNGKATPESENVTTQILASFNIAKNEVVETSPSPTATPVETPNNSPGGP